MTSRSRRRAGPSATGSPADPEPDTPPDERQHAHHEEQPSQDQHPALLRRSRFHLTSLIKPAFTVGCALRPRNPQRQTARTGESQLPCVRTSPAPHNTRSGPKRGFEGELAFRHDPISASTIVLQVGPIPAGTYHFICEVH